ncbi:MAG: hypothetical protein EZS28_023383 [Streblomastix strix]|uniref:Uncharacterized protein n=1 Tax=Streblomastix strix TaxID=222440 RepID=A0A5J4VEW2_9EUKA|nr:MAG: hypothetical protein EZS28_023383 [Streblomastix strix]
MTLSLQTVGPVDFAAALPYVDDIEVNGQTFTNTNGNFSTILFNPPISSGIVKIELLNCIGLEGFGIADKLVHYDRNEHPYSKGWRNIVQFERIGKIQHYDDWIGYLKQFEDGCHVALEVNMDNNPRTLTFFVGNEEIIHYITNIPDSIRFWAFLMNKGDSFQVLKFERLGEPSAKHGEGSRAWEYGTIWK